MKRRVVDSSVVIKWYVNEVGSDRAVDILQDLDSELWAPDLLVAEAGNILWKKWRLGELTQTRVVEIGEILGSPARLPVQLLKIGPLLAEALSLALQFGRTVYDALYLAATIEVAGEFVTADKRLANAIHSPFWTSRLVVI